MVSCNSIFSSPVKDSFSKTDLCNKEERQGLEMSFSDKKPAEDESGRSKKKQKKEDAWRPEGPRDPIAMVCFFDM